MWWEDDSQVGSAVRGLLGRWREGELLGVVGVGSTWSRRRERVPFVAFEAGLDPRPWLWAPAPGDKPVRRLIRAAGPLPPPHPKTVEVSRGDVITVVATPSRLQIGLALLATRRIKGDGEHLAPRLDVVLAGLEQLGRRRDSIPPEIELPLRQLQRLELQGNTRIGYVGSLRPTARAGLRVLSPRGKSASLGCVVKVSAGPLLTTAGHLDAELGEHLFSLKRLRFRPTPETAIGLVAATTHPRAPDFGAPGADGIDICAAEQLGGAPSTFEEVRVRDATSIEHGDVLSWTGGESGERRGWVAREMAEVKHKGLRYRNALIVNGPWRGAGRDGDSGSAVWDEHGDLVGHFVATIGYHEGGKGQSAVVQDARSAIRYLDEKLGPVEGIMRRST
jgi:hypothetical protein